MPRHYNTVWNRNVNTANTSENGENFKWTSQFWMKLTQKYNNEEFESRLC
jgi:hypothetical protein